ncbi:MAG TPA: AfsR/SARP family transcriptional regulator, partial [Ilumatobacteraceae bacterium]|nr:AfsR/SARP family transcriptional regulator [Ilumatobacteraceae bacterium]
MVLVRLLGPVEVTDAGGTAHPVGSALRRTLLALLALRAGEMVTADWLLENVWAGDPPESGLRALRFHVSRLRKELDEDGLIETRPGGYRLAISADQVDALATQRMADAARRENDPFHAAEMYGEALRLWRGEPFADASPCALLDDEAGRLDALRLAIIEDHFGARLDAGGGRELVADLSRATAQFPLRESLWSLLITAQYRAGLQADALRSFEQMRTMLSDDLGLDPSRELQDLQRRVLQHDPSLGGAGIGASDDERYAVRRTPRTLPVPASTLIDSTDQLGAAKRLVRDHRLVTLAGAGGIGKTRLAVELARSC